MTASRGHPLDWLDDQAARRRSAGLRRRLSSRPPRSRLLDLAGNDYLGLARDRRVLDGGIEALRTWGAGATGSRLVTGTTELHTALERELAAFAGGDCALVFSSGYAANLGVVTALAPAGTLIISDAANHASLIDACRLARGRVAVAPHNEIAAVETLLAGRSEDHAIVVTESVDSVDGDHAPLIELHDACRRHGAVLLIDEAHGLGVCGPGGRGVAAGLGLTGLDDVVLTVTLSKALGSQGGAVIGPHRVIDHLVDTARTMIFDTGLAPASAGAARAALRILAEHPALPANVLGASAALAEAGGVEPRTSAIVPILFGAPEDAVAAARKCADLGVQVGCFRPPSVPEGTSRLRVTARADLTGDELRHAREVLRAVLREAMDPLVPVAHTG